MAKYPDRRSAALPCLAAAQKVHGWCSPEAIRQTAAVMRLTPGYCIAVASFYDMFSTLANQLVRVDGLLKSADDVAGEPVTLVVSTPAPVRG